MRVRRAVLAAAVLGGLAVGAAALWATWPQASNPPPERSEAQRLGDVPSPPVRRGGDFVMAEVRVDPLEVFADAVPARRADAPGQWPSSAEVSPPAEPPMDALVERVKDLRFDAAAFLEESPSRKDELVLALEGCAGPSRVEEHCLRQLVRVDRAAAALRAAVAPKPTSATHGELRSELARFPERVGLLGWLAEQRWVGLDAAGFDLRDVLFRAGLLVSFPARGFSPRADHAALLSRLAALAPALAGARFAQRAGLVDGGGDHRLHAWWHEKHLVTDGVDFGGFYDVDAVLGLLNATLREAGSDWRYLCVASAGADVSVVVGPRGALDEAVSKDLLAGEEASAAMNVGVLERPQR